MITKINRLDDLLCRELVPMRAKQSKAAKRGINERLRLSPTAAA